MRKVLIIIVTVAMVLSLAACGEQPVQERMEKVEKGMEVDEAVEILGEDYEEIVFEYKFAGESFIIYEQEDNKAAVVYTVDGEVESVEWVEDYELWKESTDAVIVDDTAGLEISVDTFFERYNEVIKEYDHDFLEPIDRSDFEAIETDMNNVKYAYEFKYGDDEYAINYHTDETDRLLYLVFASLIDFDEDNEVLAKRHSDLFNIITRATIGKAVSDVGLEELKTVGDYDVLNMYSGHYYVASIRHSDTY